MTSENSSHEGPIPFEPWTPKIITAIVILALLGIAMLYITIKTAPVSP